MRRLRAAMVGFVPVCGMEAIIYWDRPAWFFGYGVAFIIGALLLTMAHVSVIREQ